MDNFQGADLEVTNSGSFGDLMDQEWSPELGKAVAFRFPYVNIYDGWVSVLPSREDGAVEFLIASDKKTLARLREDVEWSNLATNFL
jgi:hypothetical protein